MITQDVGQVVAITACVTEPDAPGKVYFDEEATGRRMVEKLCCFMEDYELLLPDDGRPTLYDKLLED